jgi:quercetin dioxygenase-like cupin family protein
VHRHDTGEVFVVIEGEIWLDEARNGPGSVVYIAPDTDYAVRAGDEGARYFRIVT